MTTQLLNSRTYDRLKQVTQIWLPAAGTLYFSLAQIWNLPYGEQVVGTITAVVLFFGILLGISKKQYEASGDDSQGTILIDSSDPDKDIYRLELKTLPEDLKGMNSVTFKVNASHDLQGL